MTIGNPGQSPVVTYVRLHAANGHVPLRAPPPL
jgi:hypothetical protein